MFLMSWLDLFNLMGRQKKTRHAVERPSTPSMADASRLEILEDRALLSAVVYNAATQQLSFQADNGVDDNVHITQPNASTLQIQVGAGEVIALQGDALANLDFVLTSPTTLLITTAPGNSPVTQLSADLGNGTNQLQTGNLVLDGITVFNGGTVQLGELTVNTGGLTVIGHQITVNGLIQAQGGGGVTLFASGSADALNDNLNIYADIEATGTSVGGAFGTINLSAGNDLLLNGAALSAVGDGIIAASAGFSRSAGALTMSGNATIQNNLGIVDLSTHGAGAVTVLGITTNSNQVTLSSAKGDVFVNAIVANSTGDLSISAGNNVLINAGVLATGAGDIDLVADSDSLGNGSVLLGVGSVVVASQANVVISGADADISSGNVTALSGFVQLQPSIVGANVNVGSDVLFGLTLADLQHISTSLLIVGSTNAGDVVVTASLHDLSTNQIGLASGSSILQLPGAIIQVNSLGIQGSGPVLLNEANQVGTLAVDLSTSVPGQPLSFTNAGSLTIGTVADLQGILTNAGTVDLRLNGPGSLLTVVQPISTGTGNVISLEADDVELNAPLNAATHQVLIHPKTEGRNINLGTNAVGSLSLTNVELNQITADALVLGSSVSPATGNVTITQSIAPGHITQLAISADAVVDQNESGIDITVPTLLIQTKNGVADQGVLTTAVSHLEVLTENEDISIDNTGDLTIGGVEDALHGLSVVNSGSIRLINRGHLFLNEVGTPSLQAGAFAGDIIVETIGVASDIVNQGPADLAIATGGNISITAGRDFKTGVSGLAQDGDLEANGDVTILAGRDVILSGDADLRADNFGNNTGGGVSITAGRDVTLQGNSGTTELPSIQTNGFQGGDIRITTGTDGVLTLAVDDAAANAAILSTSSGNIELHADHLLISGFAVISSAGNVSIAPKTAGRKIDLGSTTDQSDTSLEISDAELDHIATNLLRIGSLQTGDVRVSNAISFNNVNLPTVALISGQSVFDGGVGTLQADQLRVTAVGHIMLDTDHHLVNTVALHSDLGEISFVNESDLQVGTVDGVQGVSTVNRSLLVASTDGRLTILNTAAEHDVDAGQGDVTIGSLSITGVILSAGADVRALGGAMVVGDQQQLDGTITATGNIVFLVTASTISASSPTIPIDLGGADSSMQLGLSDAELDRMSAAAIEIGSFSPLAGTIIKVTGNISPQQAATLILNGDSVLQAGGSIRVPNLELLTQTGVGNVTPLQTQVSRLAFYNQVSGDVNIDNTGALIVGTVNDLQYSVNLTGAVTLTTQSPLTVADSLFAGGDITLWARESIDAGDDLTIESDAVVKSFGGSISLKAGDTLNQFGSIEVQVAGASMTLAGGHGDLDGFGAVTLSGTLATYDRSPQIFGGSGSDTITINHNDGLVIGGGVVGLNIDAGTGNDVYRLNFDQGPFTRDIAIADASGGLDQLAIKGKTTNDTVVYDSGASIPTITINDRIITFTGLETADIDAQGASADALQLVENIAGFQPVGDGSVDTTVPLTFHNFETVTINNTLPTLSTLNVIQSAEGGVATLTGTFSDAEQHFGEIFVVHVTWGDGTPVVAVPVTFTMANQTFSVTHTYLDDNPSGTSQDDFAVLVTVSDDNAGQSQIGHVTATVLNVNPKIFVLNSQTAANEGGTLTFTGTYSDVGTADTHQLLVDWNDGSPIETFNVSNGTFSISHVYIDEDLSGMSSDLRTPTLTIQDDDGGTAAMQTLVLVHNVAPTMTNLEVTATVVEGSAVTLSGTYSDPGSVDTHSLIIDWGDGSALQTVVVSGGQFSVQHVYADDAPSGTVSDPVNITAVLSDNDGDSSASQGVSTTVTNSVPTLANLTLVPALFENGIATLEGDVVDAGSLDVHTLEIDWGDGSPLQTVTIVGSSFSVPHQYLDDDPSGSTSDNATIVITLKDDDLGSSSITGPITIVNLVPSVDTVLLSATTIDENGIVTLSGTYSDVGSLDTHKMRINWGDDSGIQSLDIAGGVFSVTHQYRDDKPTSVGIDTMYINLVIVDDDQGMDVASTQLEVHNVNPEVTIDGAPATGPEGTMISLTSTVTDPGTVDTFTYAWSVTKNGSNFLSASTPNFSFTPDDAGTYLVSLVVIDDDGGTGTATPHTINVTNVAPTAGITGPGTVVTAAPVQFTLQAIDPSSVDQTANFTFHIDWNGDGSSDETIVGPSGSVVTHVFSATGTATVQVTATDKDGAISNVANQTVTVVATWLQDGILTVGGTEGQDRIRIKDLRDGKIEVLLNGVTQGKFTPQLIKIYGGEGNDRIQIDSMIRVPVQLYGGAGNDWLSGGKADDLLDGGAGQDRLQGRRGNDILIGGEGDDRLEGSDGSDILIGGLGRDKLKGGTASNILIGGSTAHDQSAAELESVRSEWMSAAAIDQRIDHLKNGGGANGQITFKPIENVPDDSIEDKLDGTSGANWFISFVTDRLNGRNRRANRNN